jgi:hypothetical protein
MDGFVFPETGLRPKGGKVIKSKSLLNTAWLILLPFLISCASGPMRAPVNAGTVIYTQGTAQHTATVMLTVPPPKVYQAMLDVISRSPDLELINQDDESYLVEVTREGWKVAGQATTMDRVNTILFIWSDAGNSGMTGQELSLRAVRNICDELRVECEMQDL